MLKTIRRISLTLAASFFSWAAVADDAVLVELYTSAGCSSCPPADALLRELGENSQVLPLALHVDYWDYLGWKDQFSQRAFTERQYAYAHVMKKRMVYTPQVVVNGLSETVGSNAMKVMDLIHKHYDLQHPVDIELTLSGSTLSIELKLDDGARVMRSDVQLVRFIPSETVQIRRGENAGRTIEYTNIVTSWESIAIWDGESDKVIRTKVDGDELVAVVLQARDQGAVLAAARLR